MSLETVSATEFKAKCLDLLDQVGNRQIRRLEITKHGRVVAVLIPPASRGESVQELHGFLRGAVVVPDGIDLTEPVLDEAMQSDLGYVHK